MIPSLDQVLLTLSILFVFIIEKNEERENQKKNAPNLDHEMVTPAYMLSKIRGHISLLERPNDRARAFVGLSTPICAAG